MTLRDYAMVAAKMAFYIRGYLEQIDYYQEEIPVPKFSTADKLPDAYYHLCCATEILGGVSNTPELVGVNFGDIQ